VIQYGINKINYNDLEVTHICKPKLKNSYINVTKDGVILKTPKVSRAYIDRLLKEKETWIFKKLLLLRTKIYVNKDTLDEKKAKLYLTQRVNYYSNKMGLEFCKLKFRKMKRRWGSCTSTKIITLNTYLYNTPDTQIDYVVVHELAHLVHMNHSKDFHNLVSSYIPQAKNLKSIQKQFYLL
jgi:predicted metal-dependent hydrolase